MHPGHHFDHRATEGMSHGRDGFPNAAHGEHGGEPMRLLIEIRELFGHPVPLGVSGAVVHDHAVVPA